MISVEKAHREILSYIWKLKIGWPDQFDGLMWKMQFFIHYFRRFACTALSLLSGLLPERHDIFNLCLTY